MTDEEMDCKAKITNEASDCADQCCHISCVVTAYRQFDGLPVDSGRAMEKAGRERIRPALLTPNKNSRPQTKLKKVNGIVVHYTANPGTDAMANRNYFESRKDKPDQTKYKVSSHFIIGLDGTIVQCIPLDEISYASNDRNKDTVSIECCHPNKSGKFSAATQTALIQLCAWLCGNYGMDTSDIIRHYDVTGKMCPKYYVKHKDAWTTLKKNISIELSRYSKKETEK